MKPPRLQEKGVDQTGRMDEDGLHTSAKNNCCWQGVRRARLPSSRSESRNTRTDNRSARLGSILFALCLSAFIYVCANGIDLCRIGIRINRWPGFNGLCNDKWDDVLDAATWPEDLTNHTHGHGEIPQYVLDYAPFVHLYSKEQFWPCDIAEHLFHVTPELDYTPIQARSLYMNLTNLDKLNEYGNGHHVYLTSDDNVEERPDWLGGEKNIPDEFDEEGKWIYTSRAGFRSKGMHVAGQSHGGRSDAPAVLITVNKGNGVVDAFWFYFYSYNLGNVVLNVRFGNHVGDWEHSLIRFHHGKPKLVFFSEHNFGEAYTYEAVEKIGKRPVVYSATGTHAMYATPGSHPYILPLGILHDETDRGPLWDPALNSHMYTYNHLTDNLRASNVTPHAPTEWFYFGGRWGDRFYPLNDNRQYGFAGEYHYVSGPEGPRFKHLGRRKVCQGEYTNPCVIRNRLGANAAKVWPGLGNGEDSTTSPSRELESAG